MPQKYFDLIDPEKIVLTPYRPDDLDDVPPAGRRMLNDGYPRKEWAIENDQWRDMVHAYPANIAFVDTKIGQVLDALESSPYGDNTIVVLWSDHGYHMGEKNDLANQMPAKRKEMEAALESYLQQARATVEYTGK